MEQKHTIKEMQDYITAREGLILAMGWCNDMRNHSTNKQDIKLIGFYMKGLSRLIDNIRIGSDEVEEVLNKYAPLIKKDKLDIHFIRNEYLKFKPFVQNTLFNNNGQPIHEYDSIDFINPQAAPVASMPIPV
ncbi:MAG: hypothetical protein LBN98_00570 [Prevotellaceae bacterium]|jgi:hypothetical protein|nr:hypothetical protein [Prevotellaceae bacterium]